jgi:hypothetical protein
LEVLEIEEVFEPCREIAPSLEDDPNDLGAAVEAENPHHPLVSDSKTKMALRSIWRASCGSPFHSLKEVNLLEPTSTVLARRATVE